MTSLFTKGRSFFSLSNLVLIVLFAGFFAFTRPNETDKKTVSVAADKMNVFYIGVDNPVTVAVEDVSSRKVTVTSKDIELIDKGKGHYIVRAKKPGDAILLISADGMEPQEVKFRVKRFPDPLAVLNNPKTLNRPEGGKLKLEEMMDSKGISLTMGNFDFDTDLEIVEFKLVRVPKKDDPVEVINRQADFNETAKRLLASAAPGDTFYFDEIKAGRSGAAGGDENLLKLNSLVFKVE